MTASARRIWRRAGSVSRSAADSRILPATLEVGSVEPLAGATRAWFQSMAVSGVAALCTPAVWSRVAPRAASLRRLAGSNSSRIEWPGRAVKMVTMASPPNSAWYWRLFTATCDPELR